MQLALCLLGLALPTSQGSENTNRQGRAKLRELIWADEFDSLDETKWTHMVSTYPPETFHYTRHNRKNSWVEDGALNLMFSLTADTYGEEFLESGQLDLTEEDPLHPCNDWGKDVNCYDQAGEDIVKPLQGARLHTEGKFSFTYGKVEIRAKLPLVPWVRPALWLVADQPGKYGKFPTNGEIDVMEATGNREYHCGQTSRGVDTVQTNLHFGPSREEMWHNYSLVVNRSHNFADEWHLWGLDWTEDYLAYSFDGVETYRLTAPGQPGGLWDMAGFKGENIYKDGGPMAPWDQDFHFILSFNTGGWPFYDTCDPPAPWAQNSTQKRREFWSRRDEWLPHWEQPFMIDYIRVFQ